MPASPKIRSILVPVDLSPCSRGALEYALLLAAPYGASIHVVYAWDAHIYAGAEGIIVRDDDGETKTLGTLVHQHAEKDLRSFLVDFGGVAALSSGVEAGHPRDVIIKLSERYDLVVMGTHGRGGVAHLMLGSVAERVVRQAHCPVVTVRR